MHDTAMLAGSKFAATYCRPGDTVLDVGGRDVNGSLRPAFEALGIKYVCVDMEAHASVDVVVAPGEPLPFDTGAVDAVVSTSCFEHDPCFWMTFREMCRVTRVGGAVYVNAPAQGPYHGYPGDNWRFYGDAAAALSVWSGRALFPGDAPSPAVVAEVFHILPLRHGWVDFTAVWRRVEAGAAAEVAAAPIVSPKVGRVVGPLELAVHAAGAATVVPFAGSMRL